MWRDSAQVTFLVQGAWWSDTASPPDVEHRIQYPLLRRGLGPALLTTPMLRSTFKST